MTIEELFHIIQRTLVAEGMKLCSVLRNSPKLCHFVLTDDDVQKKPIGNGDFGGTAFFGHWVELTAVDPNNGRDYVVSYTLSVCECSYSSSHNIREIPRLKLSLGQTESTYIRKVKNFVQQYRDYMTELEIERLMTNDVTTIK